MYIYGGRLSLSLSLSFPFLGRILRLGWPQHTLDPQPGKLSSPQTPEFWPSCMHGLSFVCPLLLLSFCGLEGTAVGTESGRPRGRRRGGALGAVFPLGDSLRGASGCRMFLQKLGDSDTAVSPLDLLEEAIPDLQAQAGVRIHLSGLPPNQPFCLPGSL